jgi:2-oxoglutarate ferredoxin oxidoreductase subunit beta
MPGRRRRTAPDIDRYLRKRNLPHIWCAGCGNGIVLGALLRAIARLELDPDRVAMVSGIGCSSRLPGYVDFNTLHTTHGRALVFASGIKLGRPDMEVIVVTGDGDATAIGGNHFIHACRRNIGITTVIVNNYIYGMTGGQVSPTTPQGDRASTAPFGNPEKPFDISGLAAAAGANYVARTTTYHADRLEDYILAGIEKKGFSSIEVLTACPTCYGRRNQSPTGVDLMEMIREQTVEATRWWHRIPEGKFAAGVLADRNEKEYTELYAELVSKAGGG